MPELTLGNVVIVEPLVVPEHRVQIGSRIEVGRAQDLADQDTRHADLPVACALGVNLSDDRGGGGAV